MKISKLTFITLTLSLLFLNFLIYNQLNYKLDHINHNNTIIINKVNTFDKLLKYIEICVLKYLNIFQDCFNKAFGGVLYIILKLVSLYFYTFQFCFSYILTILKILILKYYLLLEFIVYRLTIIPNNILIVIMFIVLYTN